MKLLPLYLKSTGNTKRFLVYCNHNLNVKSLTVNLLIELEVKIRNT